MPRNKGHMNFYECCDLTKKYIQYNYYLQIHSNNEGFCHHLNSSEISCQYSGDTLLYYTTIYLGKELYVVVMLWKREKLRSNQRRSSSAENKIFFVGKKYVGYFSSGLVKGKFGMKLGLKLRRANLGLYHFESQWLFHGILLQISISNNNIMVLMGVREGREREIKCLNENILSQHHHRNENLAQGFFLQTEMNFLAYSC